jgi:hypothetical protein
LLTETAPRKTWPTQSDKVEKMKRYILLIIIMAAFAGLSAQTGLFDISYDDPWPKADSLLAMFGYLAEDIDGPMVKYYSEKDPMVEAVILFIKPETLTVAGWFVKHRTTMTTEMDQMVVDRVYDMHGESTHYDKDTEQLIWILSPARSIHLLYVSDGSLCVLYTDSDYEDLFTVDKNMNKKAQGQPAEVPAPKPATPDPE